MLSEYVHSVVEAGREWLSREKTSGLLKNDIEKLCFALLRAKGEATSAALAFDIVKTFRCLSENERALFYDVLVSSFDLNVDALIESARAYKLEHSHIILRQLISKSESLRQELFRRINQAHDGTALLVSLRAEVILNLHRHPDWALIDLDLEHLFSSWFNRGFLRVKKIDWSSPATLLEKLMEYESVHAIKGWDDLRRRLADDRRCYAFFHPVMKDEPLIFVEVALVKGMAKSIEKILEVDSGILPVTDADTAVFYSINNCQTGLRGISFGDFLIKQVVSEIQKDIPGVKLFATLSPVPGFRKWLAREITIDSSEIVNSADRKLILDCEKEDWFSDKSVKERLEPILTSLCAYYLTEVRRSSEPLDPVARFHLRNGAQLNRVNWLGDCSEKGFNQSFGILVNYVYDIDSIERNHEDYLHHGRMSVSDSVKKLSKKLTATAGDVDLHIISGKPQSDQ